MQELATIKGHSEMFSFITQHNATDVASFDATIGMHNQRISAQTVRSRLRIAHLHARHPHQGLDLTAIHRRNRLE